RLPSSLERKTSSRSCGSTRRRCPSTEPMSKTTTRTEASAPKRRRADAERSEPQDALKRVLLATWRQLSQFHNILQININRLAAKELRRRHLAVTTQIVPLLERGQQEGVFRRDVSAGWLIAVVRAIVHVASTELQAGRLSQADVERTMLTTALNAIRPL